MKYPLTIISFILLFLGFSCKPNNREEIAEIQLKSIGQTSLMIDETTPDFSMGLQYFESGQEMVFNINWTTNSLQMYDLENGELIKNIQFEREGDQGVGELMAFHVHTMDSIFLFPFGTSYFSLADTSGKVKKRFGYEAPENHTPGFVHNISYISPPIVKGNEIILKTRPAIVSNYNEMSNEMLAKSHLTFRLDLDSLKTTLLPQFYPADYLEKGTKRFDFSMVKEDGKLVYSFFGDHNLYWAENLEGPLKSIDGRSTFLNEALPLFPKGGPALESQKYSFASSRYENLLYDRYQEVYYRFAYPDLEVETEGEVRALRNNPGPFVVMVFDKELKLLGETYFEGGKYLPMNAFVGKKGLYLSTNNPDNPKNQEDKMGFEVYFLL
ncbi:DUF4221 family protein [Pararhodonellum marinum]|uniref:DUF4221 family protein n=1 Tax=Pararhodonellum marinum TaxID=2755358 RepID=UPI00188EE285|nr:DUF4221 family protein [Pararhodonellum marinum]